MPEPRRTAFYREHQRLEAHLTSFAGWELPLHYPAGAMVEHRAVRTAGGLFDIGHLGIFKIKGEQARVFLERLLASDVSALGMGQAQYTYMLAPDGKAIDDLYLYRIGPLTYLVVANAANSARVWTWLERVRDGKAGLDMGPYSKDKVILVNLHDPGPLALVGMALQGPQSKELLNRLVSPGDRAILDGIRFNRIGTLALCDARVIVSGTGYTGERPSFEFFVHPDQAPAVWGQLLKVGQDLGIMPCGLASRDSLRIEAGCPLFGNELEGPCELTLSEAGFGGIIRKTGPPFVGRDAYLWRVAVGGRHVLRLRGKGRKDVRAGHVIVDDHDKVVGRITSFAFTDSDFNFSALACVDPSFNPPTGKEIRGVRHPLDQYTPPPTDHDIVPLAVVRRHPDKDERQQWREQYQPVEKPQ